MSKSHTVELLFNRINHSSMRMAQARHRSTSASIKVTVALCIDNIDTIAAPSHRELTAQTSMKNTRLGMIQGKRLIVIILTMVLLSMSSAQRSFFIACC
jgi:hypothetical protein